MQSQLLQAAKHALEFIQSIDGYENSKSANELRQAIEAVEQSVHPTGLESPLKTVSMAYYRVPKKSNPVDPPCG